MKNLTLPAFLRRMSAIVLSVGFLFCMNQFISAQTLDERVDAFMEGKENDGERVPIEILWAAYGENSGDLNDEAHTYFSQVKMSLLDPVKQGGWPRRSTYVKGEALKKTYDSLKALYLKNKSPLVAYALICPSLYLKDMEIIPELTKTISANAPLKKSFDDKYPDWKKRIAPDL